MVAKRGLWSAGMVLALVLAGCGSLHQSAGVPGAGTHAKTLRSAVARDATSSSSPIQLDDVAMVTGQDGWALASGSVVVTRDAGRKWRRVTPAGFPPTSAQLFTVGSIAAAFPTARDGVVAQERASTIRVWRTTDGGLHWKVGTWTAPETDVLRVFHGSLSMTFTNAREGLIMLSSQGNAGSTTDVLLATSDGGRHWHLLRNTTKNLAAYLGLSPTTALGDISDLSLSPSGRGLASINTVIGGRAWVLTTANGGQSWASRTLPLPPGSTQDSVSEGPQVVQGAKGEWVWITLFNNHTNSPQWLMDHTTDGGTQWTSIRWNQSIPPLATLGGVYLWPQSHGVLVLVADSHGTEIWRWTPHSSWQRVSHLPLQKIESVSLLPTGDGWIIGGTGNYHTTNGGMTWKAFAPQMN